MNIALFAAREVGNEIAKFFGKNKEPLSCLVLDTKDMSETNARIVESSGCAEDKVLYSNSLYTEQTSTALAAMNLDLIILAWWPYIIKQSLIKLPLLGCLNFHPSYLPHNRGKHPNFWSIVEDVPFGVTLHFVDEGIDSGDIAFQTVIEKSWEDTGQSLYGRAQLEIVRLFEQSFCDIRSGLIPRRPQNLALGSFHKSDEIQAASRVELDQTYTARELLNLLRARTFRPHPSAWFIDGGRKYEVRIEITKTSDTNEDET